MRVGVSEITCKNHLLWSPIPDEYIWKGDLPEDLWLQQFPNVMNQCENDQSRKIYKY